MHDRAFGNMCVLMRIYVCESRGARARLLLTHNITTVSGFFFFCLQLSHLDTHTHRESWHKSHKRKHSSYQTTGLANAPGQADHWHESEIVRPPNGGLSSVLSSDNGDNNNTAQTNKHPNIIFMRHFRCAIIVPFFMTDKLHFNNTMGQMTGTLWPNCT